MTTHQPNQSHELHGRGGYDQQQRATLMLAAQLLQERATGLDLSTVHSRDRIT
jgi:hypothetical protein